MAAPAGGRRCKTCGADYEYPARTSLATRWDCEECSAIDERLRRVLRRLRRRIDELAAEVQALSGELREEGQE